VAVYASLRWILATDSHIVLVLADHRFSMVGSCPWNNLQLNS